MDLVPNSSRGTLYQFLNAGTVIGYAHALISLFECVIAEMAVPGFKGDDQLAMTTCYIRDQRRRFTIDYDTKLIGVVPPDRALFDLEWTVPNEVTAGESPMRRRGGLPTAPGPGVVHFAGVRYLDQADQVGALPRSGWLVLLSLRLALTWPQPLFRAFWWRSLGSHPSITHTESSMCSCSCRRCPGL
jgi:hypothetical protein